MLDLQLFGNEAVQGKKIVYLYRILSEAPTQSGTALAFTTENGRTKSKDADSTATKDGSIRTPGAAEVEITATSILKKGDELINKLAEPAEAGNNKFKGTYFQGYLTEIEYTANADEFVEVSLTFGINGTGADGDVTVTTQQQEQAYAFVDTPKTGA